MRRPITSLLAITGGLAVATVAAASSTPAAKATSRSVTPVFADTVTGCLQKGTSSNVYKLVQADGKSINVKSSAVQLSGHVGHEVQLTTSGAAMAGDTGAVNVSKMKMVSSKCGGM
jgi:hypothetical protein